MSDPVKIVASPLDDVYEKFKHLDGCLSDPEWCTSGEGAAIYAIAGELWRAVKEARNQPRPACEECIYQSQQPEPTEKKCHTCRTLQWDNRLIWSLEELLAWVREKHMDQQDIRDHIDLMLGKYRQELESRQPEPTEREPE